MEGDLYLRRKTRMIEKPDYGDSNVRWFEGGLLDQLIDQSNANEKAIAEEKTEALELANQTEERLTELERHTHGIIDADTYYGLSNPKPGSPLEDEEAPSEPEKADAPEISFIEWVANARKEIADMLTIPKYLLSTPDRKPFTEWVANRRQHPVISKADEPDAPDDDIEIPDGEPDMYIPQGRADAPDEDSEPPWGKVNWKRPPDETDTFTLNAAPDELKACDECRATGAYVRTNPAAYVKTKHVWCANCGRSTGLYKTDAEAISAWNRRPEEDRLKADILDLKTALDSAIDERDEAYKENERLKKDYNEIFDEAVAQKKRAITAEADLREKG
jgi:hypothetical protein